MGRARQRRPLTARRGWVRTLLVVVILVVAWYVQSRPDNAETRGAEEVNPAVRAYRAGASDVMMTIDGVVSRVLPDDNEGSRHQRFVIRVERDHTVLVSHNIDLARRVPLDVGDRVTVSGEYEWNERGGVIHWTHHDPQGRRDGGWIDHDGKRYR